MNNFVKHHVKQLWKNTNDPLLASSVPGVLATGIMAVNAIIYGNPTGAVSGDQTLGRDLKSRFGVQVW